MNPSRTNANLVIVIFILPFLCGCISTKSIVYFNNLPDSSRVALETILPPVPKIQVNDRIEIRIGGENEKTVEYIARQFAGNNSSASIETIVDLNGNIELPQIGLIRLSGFTKEEAKAIITNAYREYLINPIIFVKFGDFRYTVLGEVRSPGTKLVPSNRISLLEAIANSGDMTEFAERKRIRIIREENFQRAVLQVDLTDRSILNSSNYYLHPNDIVYVAAKDVKQTTSNFQRSMLMASGIASLVTIFIVLFKR